LESKVVYNLILIAMWIKGGYVEGKTKTATGWILATYINIQTNTHTHTIYYLLLIGEEYSKTVEVLC
jgi:hypothetical protein